MYIWQKYGWTNFQIDMGELINPLAEFRYQQGLLLGSMQTLGFHLQEEAFLQSLTSNVVKTSSIEGELLDSEEVRSSLAMKLGINIGGLKPVPRHVDGIVEVTLDATRNYKASLAKERLFAWHSALFPTGYSGLTRIKVGAFRDDTKGVMQVISGKFGKERVHFTAPPASSLSGEIEKFLTWFNAVSKNDLVIKAGLAHFWFITLHPFDDGNGRIARTIGDMALAQSEDSSMRFYSLSNQIEKYRKEYYTILEKVQSCELTITDWLLWFIEKLTLATHNAQEMLSATRLKHSFWTKANLLGLNERQRKVLNLLLDDFEGNLTSSKWAKLCKCSQDTAHRDIVQLIELGLVEQEGQGRGTSYKILHQ